MKFRSGVIASMSTSKKASRRLVQPRPEHYKQRVREDGKTEDVLCGPYSIAQRDKWFEVQISLALTRNPNLTNERARRATFQKWRNLVFSTIADEYVFVASKKKADHPDDVVIVKDRTE